MDEPVHSLPQPPLPSVGNGESETIGGRVFCQQFCQHELPSHMFQRELMRLAAFPKSLEALR